MLYILDTKAILVDHIAQVVDDGRLLLVLSVQPRVFSQERVSVLLRKDFGLEPALDDGLVREARPLVGEDVRHVQYRRLACVVQAPASPAKKSPTSQESG